MAKPASANVDEKTVDTTAVDTTSATETVAGELESIVPGETHPQLRAMLRRQSIEASLATANGQSSDEFVFALMEKILAADTAEEIFAAQESGMVAGKDFTNRPFYLTIDGISIHKSSKDNGFPFFAIMNVVEIATGEEVTINCGGKTFMAVLEGLRQRDYFAPSDEYPHGRPMTLLEKPSEAGAYLLFMPYKMAPVQRGKNK